jgi:peptidoglycan/LPS O-acetylase OafA/YrhL
VTRPRLPALASLQLLACLHIYFFRIIEAHLAGLLKFEAIDQLPSPLLRLLSRGFVSTGLFFQLSGFLLAYAYLRPDGQPKVPDRALWSGRFVRLYPLYIISLVLLVPAPALLPITTRPPSRDGLTGLVVTNLTSLL